MRYFNLYKGKNLNNFTHKIPYSKIVSKSFSTKSSNTSKEVYYKIFSVDYIQQFHTFLDKIMNDFKKDQNALKMEKDIFKYLFSDRQLKINIFEIPPQQEDSTNINLSQQALTTRKKFIISSSKFIELCYNNKLYQPNFSEFNKVIFYYLITFHDVSNRKFYRYFNIHLILYFLSNPEYEATFKRFIVSKLLANMDLLKYKQFLILLDFACKEIHHKNNFDLFFPFNPMKLDRKLMTNYFNSSTKFSYKDLIQTLYLTDEFPFAEKRFLLENVLERMESLSETILTAELIGLIKGIKLLECEYEIKNVGKNLFENNKTNKTYEDFKMKAMNKLKFRIKTNKPEDYYNNISNFFNLIDTFVANGRFIINNEIFNDLFTTIIKTSEKNEIVKNSFYGILERFIELHPSYIIKILLPVWSVKIPKCSLKDASNILKTVIYAESFHLFKDGPDEGKYTLLKEFCKQLLNDSNNKYVSSLDEAIESTFYLTYMHLFEYLDNSGDLFSTTFLENRLDLIVRNLRNNCELNVAIIDEIESGNYLNDFSFSLEKLNKWSLKYLYLLSLYIEHSFKETEHYDQILNIQRECERIFKNNYSSKDKIILKRNSKNGKTLLFPINEYNKFYLINKSDQEQIERLNIITVENSDNSENIKTELTEFLMENFLIKVLGKGNGISVDRTKYLI